MAHSKLHFQNQESVTIADFASKPFSSKQLCTHLKCLKLFSALGKLVLTL